LNPSFVFSATERSKSQEMSEMSHSVKLRGLMAVSPDNDSFLLIETPVLLDPADEPVTQF